ncbi:SET and MYND domain-containing protein 5 [Balamuthia mandrillaris]
MLLRARRTHALSSFVAGASPGGGPTTALRGTTRWHAYSRYATSSASDGASAKEQEEESVLHRWKAYYEPLCEGFGIEVGPSRFVIGSTSAESEAREEESTPRDPAAQPLLPKALFATRPFRAGEIVFTEEPVVTARAFSTPFHKRKEQQGNQHAHGLTLHHDRLCDHCLRSLALPDMCFPEDTSPEERSLLPFIHNSKLWPQIGTTVETADGKMYCSESCKTKAYDRYQQYLGSAVDGAHPYARYEAICREINSGFPIQVARMYASMLLPLFSASSSSETSSTAISSALWNQTPISKFSSSWQPLPMFELKPELARAKAFIYGGEAAKLLQQAFKDTAPSFAAHDALFSNEFYSWIYNTVHMNCSSAQPKSPWETYAHNLQMALSQQPPDIAKSVASTVLMLSEFLGDRHQLSSEERQMTIFHLLTRSGGSALYALHSCMNHSCDANAAIRNQQDDAKITVIARKDIPPGHEICIDYAGFYKQGRLPSVEQRRAILYQNFGFECCCPLCLSSSSSP